MTSCSGSQRVGSRLFACNFHVCNMTIAISLLLVLIRVFYKNLLVPFFPFSSGKIMLAQALPDKNKS